MASGRRPRGPPWGRPGDPQSETKRCTVPFWVSPISPSRNGPAATCSTLKKNRKQDDKKKRQNDASVDILELAELREKKRKLRRNRRYFSPAAHLCILRRPRRPSSQFSSAAAPFLMCGARRSAPIEAACFRLFPSTRSIFFLFAELVAADGFTGTTWKQVASFEMDLNEVLLRCSSHRPFWQCCWVFTEFS